MEQKHGNESLTSIWQYNRGDTNETLMGKKSSELPGIENSRLPVLLAESITGIHHSKICLRVS